MMRLAVTLWLLLVYTLPALAGGKTAYPFAVITQLSGDVHQVVARNSGPAPVSVRLTLANAENVSIQRALPVYAVVQAYSELLLLLIQPMIPGRNHRFATQSIYKLGSIVAVPDPLAVYRLPYENGYRFFISQAAGGPITTHDGEDSRYAVDLTMPENTPVVAAREGLVIGSDSSHRLGGRNLALMSMANFVSILHDDQTVATYAHLAPGGVRVRPGD